MAWVATALGAGGLCGLACQPALTMYPPIQGCIVDSGACGSLSGGGVVTTGTGSGGGDAGTGGESTTTDVTGSVALIATTTFDPTQTSAFNGMANIKAFSPAGLLSAAYGGSAGSTFTLDGVLSGQQWFLVQDASGGAGGIFSTWSLQDLPVATPITLPVVSSQTLTNIASTLPSVTSGLSAGLSHVVMLVSQGGAPYPNVTVTGGTGSATVAYDQGPGTYSDTATVTGSAGVIILFNSTLSGPSTITLTDEGSKMTYTTTIQTGQGAVSLAFLGLP